MHSWMDKEIDGWPDAYIDQLFLIAEYADNLPSTYCIMDTLKINQARKYALF